MDSAESTAQVVAERLQELRRGPVNFAAKDVPQVRMKFFATDSIEKFRRLGKRFLSHPIEDVYHVDLKE